ncbi:Putative Fe-S oxidoreductase [Croceitalea dokdonensis DOKDO 023]|uniref:Putative Fe-S oxidoreductase n=1 Tax=Croceitalea dokdonensis DOKDO 023 TaxID=1300341 RepID=A0A0P7AFX1_9FLAO|nr:radical SAM protein [Croceitalea dokdonensis]KPM30954.1 Putative Fe-S oxidoreductase [Croceitalea dokdonensis DOKDO 023]
MKLPKSINYFYEYYLNPGFGNQRYILPSHVNFPITDNCNSKCRMCNVWKDKSENELTPEEIQTIYSNKLFKNTKHLGISGGEPTLRKDLLACVEAILTALPRLKSLSITSHGFHPTKWQRQLPLIVALCKKYNTFFKLNISVDGIGELHEEVRRIEGGWAKVVETIDVAKSNNVPVQIQCTVSKHNVFGVNEVLHFAKSNNLEYIFRRATSINRLYNHEITNEFFNSNQDDSFFADFVTSTSVTHTTENPGRRLFYKDLAKRLTVGGNRKAPCHFQYNGVLISAHGEMYHCSIDEEPLGDCRTTDPYEVYFAQNSREQLEALLSSTCPSCIHDQSGAWNPILIINEVLSQKFPFFPKIKQLSTFAFANLKSAFGISPRNIGISEAKNTAQAHIIGAYGGEHVGDSAILGGVILRIAERHPNLKNVVVYSKRPDRTKFWVRGLDFESELTIVVKPYTILNALEASAKDVLFWAGGPIMEMPIDLFEHLKTIDCFVKNGLRFEIVGCGWGPFKTKYSRAKANSILNKAAKVEMRDKYDLPVEYQLNQDPAFDYLLSGVHKEPKISWSRKKTDDFLDKVKTTQQDTLVLLNLRPIWDKYNKSNQSSAELDDQVVNEVFQLIKKLPHHVALISVPFNTDHYGFSDMEPALRLKDKCTAAKIKNFHVFDRELNARDMQYFLKSFDLGICMRFHACIFMKSLDIPVYGIDYTAGEIGKVGGLFKSFNDDNWSNIMDLNHKQILKFIERQ